MAAVYNFLRVLTQRTVTLHLQFIGLSGIPYQCKCLLEQCCHPEMEPSHQTSKSIKLPMRPSTSLLECHGSKTQEHVANSFH